MNRLLYRLCFVALLLASIVVVLGAYTRLVHAGLGCPDWPTCYGHFWVPQTQDDVARANEAFAHAPVEHDKTWPEQLHRLAASTLGLMILAIFIICYRDREPGQHWWSVNLLLSALVVGTVMRVILGDVMDPYLWILVAAYFINLCRVATHNVKSEKPFKLPALIAGLVILQGLFGMWTVTLLLWPKVVTLHLLGGFATLSLLWLLFQRAGHWHWSAAAETVVRFMRMRPLALAALLVVALQIALGGWISSNYAALACPDFPLCQNQVWPDAKFAEGFNLLQDIGPNYLGGRLDNEARIAIHLTHRVGALVVTLVLLALAFSLWRSRFRQAQNFAIALVVALFGQLTLGILNIVLFLPLWVAVAHNAVGAILLLVVVTINHRLRTVKTL